MNRQLAAKGTWPAFLVLNVVAWAAAVHAQPAAPPVILEVDLENYVQYWDDLADPAKLASVPSRTTVSSKAFMQNVWVADVVAVNGRRARGTFVNRTQSFSYRPSPTPGQNVADINRNGGPSTEVLEIQQADGTPVGTVMGIGLVAGSAPPGSPNAIALSNTAIVGGTGAFLGARGQCGIANSSGVRNASQSEDPSLRRELGGGTMRMVLYLIPASRPEVVMTATGPAVVHSNAYNLVNSSAPARAGEVLSVFVRGLGPTRPNIPPGTAFPSSPLASAVGPVSVTLNEISAEVLGAAGYPGSTDGYQVNFRVPNEIQKGTAELQVSSAWIPSASVPISVQ
jgi:hypothetical protein